MPSCGASPRSDATKYPIHRSVLARRSAALGGAIAKLLGVPLSPIEETEFGGGERKLRPLEDVRGRSACVIHSLFGGPLGSANDHLCEMLFLIGALKDAGARRITACAPYLAYARQDRRIESGDPVTTRYVAQLFEAVGVGRVICLDVHDPAAFENAFRCGTVHVDAGSTFVQHVASKPSGLEYVVASPDIGGAKRARHFHGLLQTALGRPVDYALMDKTRSRGGLSGTLFAGDVAGKHVIILDDLISSGTTVLRAVGACRRAARPGSMWPQRTPPSLLRRADCSTRASRPMKGRIRWW